MKIRLYELYTDKLDEKEITIHSNTLHSEPIEEIIATYQSNRFGV